MPSTGGTYDDCEAEEIRTAIGNAVDNILYRELYSALIQCDLSAAIALAFSNDGDAAEPLAD